MQSCTVGKKRQQQLSGDQSIYWSLNQLINKSINHSINQSINQPINQCINSAINHWSVTNYMFQKPFLSYFLQFPNKSINQSNHRVSKQQMVHTEKCIYHVGIIIIHLDAFINAKTCFMDPNQKSTNLKNAIKSNLHTAVRPRTKIAPRKLFEYIGLHMIVFFQKHTKMKHHTRRIIVNLKR